MKTLSTKRQRLQQWLAWTLGCSLGTGLFLGVAQAQLLLDPPPGQPEPAPVIRSTVIGSEPGAAGAIDTDELEEFEEVEGVTPLLRGPLHEAYAERFDVDGEEAVVVSKEPPAWIDEQPPEVRPEGDNYVWIPGYWGWDIMEEDFVWVSGIWRKAPYQHQWVPGYWTDVEGGWQWVSGFWAPDAEEKIVYLPPPPDNIDNGPSSPAPGDDYFWYPGSWNYSSGNYAWRSGYWSVAHSDWVWIPTRYLWTPSGYVCRPGYWDYRLPERGIVFTPVRFVHGYSHVYRPRYTVQVNPLLLANMFVARGFSQYYYGNYFGYQGHRTVHSWVTYYRHGYDPFLCYYAYQGRHKSWLHNLHRLERQIATTPRLQSHATVAAQFGSYRDLRGRPSEVDTLMRVASARHLAERRPTSYQSNIHLHIDRSVRSNAKVEIVDPIRDFERKRRDLERAVTDVDRKRARPGSTLGENSGKVELKELTFGGRDTHRGRPSVPRDIRARTRVEDRIATDGTNRSRTRPEGTKPDGIREGTRPDGARPDGERPDGATRDRQPLEIGGRDRNPGAPNRGDSTRPPRPNREERTKQLDSILGGDSKEEKLNDNQLRDLRRELLGNSDSVPRRGSGPSGTMPPQRGEIRRTETPRGGTPSPDRPRTEIPRIETPRIETPRIETPRIESPRIGTPRTGTPRTGTPRIETPRIERPRTGGPQIDAPRTGGPQTGTPRTGGPRIETPRTGGPRIEAPRTNPSGSATPRISTPRIETPRVEPRRVETPRLDRQFSRPEMQPRTESRLRPEARSLPSVQSRSSFQSRSGAQTQPSFPSRSSGTSRGFSPRSEPRTRQ